MTGLAGLSMLRPLWLLALPAIIALAVFLRSRQSGIGDWDRVIDPALMQAMRALGRVDNTRSRVLLQLPLWAAGMVAIALAGPAFERRDAQAFRNLDGVVFVMDVSASLTEDPLWPAMVTMGRIGVDALGSKPAALVVFSGDAYVASALTTNTKQIGLTMALLNEKTVPDKGSRPTLGLEQAVRILERAEIVAGDVVLMTDGAGLGAAALAVAKAIAEQGARLSVVHAPTGTATKGVEQLRTLASIGGGDFFELNDGDTLAASLNKSPAERLKRQDYLLLFWADYGRFFLFPALIPVLGLFRRAHA